MLERGIVDLDGLARAAADPSTRREVSAPLLWTALQADPARWGPVCHAAFNRMRMGNGVYKYTAPHRFDDIAPKLLEVLEAGLRGTSPLVVHDLGVSDGTTSVEWYGDLRRHWTDVRFTMSDWFDCLYVVRLGSSPWTCVLDAALNPIQYVGRGFVLTPQRRAGWRRPVNRLLLSRLESTLGPAAQAAARAADLAVDPPRAPAGASIERIRMVSRSCRDLLESDPATRFVRHSVLDPLPERCHLVRAMNVLNRSYFTAEQLALAIRHVRDGLHDGGFFVVGRCIDEQDGRTTCTVYRRRGPSFEFIARFHEGSELEPVVAALRG